MLSSAFTLRHFTNSDIRRMSLATSGTVTSLFPTLGLAETGFPKSLVLKVPDC
jgi:hypothetical protein